jgi:hypothetical protein
MLADGVEAASRGLEEPSSSRIRGLVHRSIEARVEAGELEECGLTLSDLTKVREAFTLVLTGIFHGRVRYPARADAARELAPDDLAGEPRKPPSMSGQTEAGDDGDSYPSGKSSAGTGG